MRHKCSIAGVQSKCHICEDIVCGSPCLRPTGAMITGRTENVEALLACRPNCIPMAFPPSIMFKLWLPGTPMPGDLVDEVMAKLA